jgi:hypothetical protein
MGIEALSPEEKAQLFEALKAEMGGGEVCECDAKFEAVAGVLTQIAEKLDALDGRLSGIEKTVMEDMIGGIRSLYDENMRTAGIEELKGKYGELFNPHMAAFSEMYPDQDLWASLHDMLGKMKSGENYTDEMGDMKIKEIADQLRGKVEKIRGPAVAKVEVAKEAPPPMSAEEDVDPMTAIVDRVKKLKGGKGRTSGIMPGAEME